MANTSKKPVKSAQSEVLLAALFALVVLAVVLYVRVRLSGMPFVREEGEYAYAGQLILKGLSPYLHAYTTKLPGMAYLNALFMLCFGQSVTAIRLGLLAANILTMLLLFFTGRNLFGTAAGLLAAAIFGITTLGHQLQGTFAHATHFSILFVLAAFLCIMNDSKPPSQYRYLFAGILFGIAFLITQQAIAFLLAAAVLVLVNARPLRIAAGNIIVMVFGFLLPYIAQLLLVLKQGAFSSFWFWTVTYASQSATGMTSLPGWITIKTQLLDNFASMLPYCILALIGLLLMLARRDKRELAFMLPLFLAAFLAIPGLQCRPHSLILVAPVIALLAGGVVSSSLLPRILKRLFLAAFFAALSFQLWSDGWLLFAASPQAYLKKACQASSPLAGETVVADYLAKNTKKSDRILVLASEPQLYFYADRIAASGHISMEPLLEEQPLAELQQQGMLQEIAAAKPVYLVDAPGAWRAVSASGVKFREKLNNFILHGYELDGVASLSPLGEPEYVFGERARQFVPDAGASMLIYRLKRS